MMVQNKGYKLFFLLVFCMVLLCLYQQYRLMNNYENLNYYNENMSYSYEDKVKLKLKEMQYACGECSFLYRIDSVLVSNNNNERNFFNKEILIDSNVELRKIDDRYYIGEGIIKRNNFGMFKLFVR